MQLCFQTRVKQAGDFKSSYLGICLNKKIAVWFQIQSKLPLYLLSEIIPLRSRILSKRHRGEESLIIKFKQFILSLWLACLFFQMKRFWGKPLLSPQAFNSYFLMCALPVWARKMTCLYFKESFSKSEVLKHSFSFKIWDSVAYKVFNLLADVRWLSEIICILHSQHSYVQFEGAKPLCG